MASDTDPDKIARAKEIANSVLSRGNSFLGEIATDYNVSAQDLASRLTLRIFSAAAEAAAEVSDNNTSSPDTKLFKI